MHTELRLKHLASRVAVIEHTPAFTGVSNCGVLHTSKGIVLIDSLLTPALAKRMCQAAGIYDPQDVAHVILTHGHIDHVGGNSVFTQATIWGTPATCGVVHRLPDFIDMCAQWMPAWAEELKQMALSGPDQELYEGRWSESTAELELRVLDFGCSHSENDVAILVEGTGVVFAGDLAFFGVTPMLLPEGDWTRWLAAIKTLLTLPITVVVPGHGPTGNKQDLIAVYDYFSSLAEHAAACYEGGRPVIEAINSFTRRVGSGWAEPGRLAVNMFSVYRHLAGQARPGSPEEYKAVLGQLRDVLDSVRTAPAR